MKIYLLLDRHQLLERIPSRHSGRNGFTLVELLVVIAIIGVLAAISYPVIIGQIATAQRLYSSTLANNIGTGIQAYYTEYGTYPIVAASAVDVLYSGGVGNYTLLMNGLCGNLNAYSPAIAIKATNINPRNIVYLTPNKADLDTNGNIKQNMTYPGEKSTPQYYSIALDADYSGILNDNGAALSIPDFTVTGAAFTTSLGAATLELSRGIAIWGNNDENPATSTIPGHWSHTY